MANRDQSSSSQAKFSCDSCRAKKLRCSRELPKCSSCKQWPGDCTYSHIATKRKRQSTIGCNVGNLAARPRPSSNDNQQRLDLIESKVTELAQVLHSNPSLQPNPKPRPWSDIPPAAPVEDTSQEESHKLQDTLQQQQGFHAFSLLSQVKADLETLKSNISSVPMHLNGSESLHEFSENLTTLRSLKKSVGLDVQKSEEPVESFYIPSHDEGIWFEEVFLETIRRGKPLFCFPSGDLLSKIIYQPYLVSHRGWVLLFNYLVLNASTKPPKLLSNDLQKQLRQNIWLALNDSKLFLIPDLINIIALMTIASHGDYFATPNLSWILVGHACRLAQAINIQLPLGSKGETESQLQRMFVFWSLFCMDKSVSLAFGRPCMLTGPLYETILLPERDDLIEFQPHTIDAGDSKFGAVFFLQSIHLAKLQGRVLTLRQSSAFIDQWAYGTAKRSLLDDLSSWNSRTQQDLGSAFISELLGRSSEEVIELKTGMEFMAFQYHHLHVHLTANDDESREICLNAARNAIDSLKRLVSTSSQVYNGIVWELLYYPFTPFFVLFSNIIRAPSAASTTGDVKLLYATQSYLSEMTSRGMMAANLEKISRIFASLAEMYVQETAAKSEYQQTSPELSCRLGRMAQTIDSSEQIFEDSEPPANEFFEFLSRSDSQNRDFIDSFVDAEMSRDIFNSLAAQSLDVPFDYEFDWFSLHDQS